MLGKESDRVVGDSGVRAIDPLSNRKQVRTLDALGWVEGGVSVCVKGVVLRVDMAAHMQSDIVNQGTCPRLDSNHNPLTKKGDKSNKNDC